MTKDPDEVKEWREALDSVINREGTHKAELILSELLLHARRKSLHTPYSSNTPYVNTISTENQIVAPGDYAVERKIRSIIRWNAAAMVVKANKKSTELGGHIASFASSATLYEVGFNHFWRATNEDNMGDLIYFQGHASPGIYARAFLEGRLTEKQLDNFRQEVKTPGLSSYPHPWLMPDFWQFPTVSMGLGPIMSIYQARFMQYLKNRGLIEDTDRKIWGFLGDGECDEPESLGAISLAGREKLDNLVFVINCNLQRLDGPVRGNGKIIQELESVFRGAGWNVIKVIWGSKWDGLISSDANGLLLKRMEEAVDGDYQNYKSQDGKFVRDNFFGKYPELLSRIAHMSDKEVWRLNRGGHDPHKVYSAYHTAINHKGQPTVILAKTVKGYGMGAAGEGQNRTHQQKKMDVGSLIKFKDRFDIPLTNKQVENLDYCKPDKKSIEMEYLHERRKALGGYLPKRRTTVSVKLKYSADLATQFIEGTKDKEMSTTMVFVRLLTTLLRDKSIAKQIVPIIPDEARTFGMEGLFRQLGIYSSIGQLYTPQDKDEVMYYREDIKGQILEEGINEAGAMSSWIASATSYSNYNYQTIPFYTFYSMFGMQRIGDLAWAAGDLRSRGFLIGGTAGRTTLAGEGLQHQDGHSLLLAHAIPNCISYDPTFAFELAVIIQHGLNQMINKDKDNFYYLTVMNENYIHPPKPKIQNIDEQIIEGIYQFNPPSSSAKINMIGAGTVLNEVIKSAQMLKKDYGIEVNVYSAPGISQAVRSADSCKRFNILNPDKPKKTSHLQKLFEKNTVPTIVATDYVRSYSELLREHIPNEFYSLGTDGFGRSDTRKNLRIHFEVNSGYITYSALHSLFKQNLIDEKSLVDARKKLNINPDKRSPNTL